jgi:hypothetical protein
MSHLDTVSYLGTDEVLLQQPRNRASLNIEGPSGNKLIRLYHWASTMDDHGICGRSLRGKRPWCEESVLWEPDPLDRHRRRFEKKHCYEVHYENVPESGNIPL